MNIAFRTDASLEIGIGHVMRCLTLARALRSAGASCRFVTRAHPGHMGARIAAEGFDVTLLPAPHGPVPTGPPAHAHWAGVDWAEDAAGTRAALDGTPDWMVMDHYAFDARWQRAACPAGTRIMVIDDLADRPHDCDLLLDQNLGHDAGDYDGLVPDRCTRLTGPRHALLRPEFAEQRAGALAARAGCGLTHLMISMGGTDAVDATSTVLGALRDAPLPTGMRISVIMGAGAPALEKVRVLAQTMPRPTEGAVDVDDMATRMAAADLAIGAGGSTTWERCCLGLPSIIVETAENQSGIAGAMARAGAGLAPGALHAPDFARALGKAVTDMEAPARLATMSQAAAWICDGDGAARVLAALLPSEVGFRAATRADSRRVWEWRHAVDRSSRMIGDDTPYDMHDAWFCRAMDDPNRTIRILVQGALPRGYMRLDREDATHARVSICLAPEARSQGLGRRLLEEADKEGRRLGLARLHAEIHPRNAASRRVFETAGYAGDHHTDGFLVCHRNLKGAS
jgi:UDP-2,4-diacetamido-2,4,6-trideoxy-beta-L-altropyranose hydrolase